MMDFQYEHRDEGRDTPDENEFHCTLCSIEYLVDDDSTHCPECPLCGAEGLIGALLEPVCGCCQAPYPGPGTLGWCYEPDAEFDGDTGLSCGGCL